MSFQVEYIKNGILNRSAIFGSQTSADGYAASVNGIVIPIAQTAPVILVKKLPDPKIVDRLRAKAVREARQNELNEIEFQARVAAKNRGLSSERIEALGKAARQAKIDEDKDANYTVCPLCEKPVFGRYSTCRNCGRL